MFYSSGWRRITYIPSYSSRLTDAIRISLVSKEVESYQHLHYLFFFIELDIFLCSPPCLAPALFWLLSQEETLGMENMDSALNLP